MANAMGVHSVGEGFWDPFNLIFSHWRYNGLWKFLGCKSSYEVQSLGQWHPIVDFHSGCTNLVLRSSEYKYLSLSSSPSVVVAYFLADSVSACVEG
jgi:hypothetical protein